MLGTHSIKIFNNEHLYGPGKRAVLFLQGCSIHCNGCINKHLWDFNGGTKMSESDIVKFCVENNVEGITIHGGEPLDQATSLIELIKLLRKAKLTVILFTGYLKKELNSTQRYVWEHSDIVVGGRFELSKRNVNLQFRGSTNQRVYFHKGPYKNYKLDKGYTVSIITMDSEGKMQLNGFYTEEIEKIVKLS